MDLRKFFQSIYNKSLVLFIFFTIFICFIAIVLIISSKPRYIYAKIRIDPSGPWLIKALRKGEKETGFLGQPVAELTNIRYYPDWTSLYTTYLTAKLKVGYNKTKKRYILRRLPITVGSKVYLELPSTTVIGTILDINKTNFNDKYKEKIIYLVNTGGWSKDAPYRYDNIKVGDKLFDGESVVFEVLDKKLQKNIWAVTNNFDAQIYEREVETTQNIIVKAKMKVKEINNTLIFGEEYRIYPNASPPLVTDNFSYDGFTIRKIE